MRIHKLNVAAREYVLTSADQAEHLKSQALEAMQNGGGFIDIALAKGRSISIMLTPGVPAFFEVIETPDQPEDDDEHASLFLLDEHDL